ncbi:unknown protein [Simkania negevensis Z]|uniref:Uncharacterized protein n=1 Tax=Simkania negevensis (strain ATCC VR-1471 / DSM 27360 / Z) TaxID=331113 RepID=F8L355_SIMNZ|nr:unknown protein [Simkania negevensis Z]
MKAKKKLSNLLKNQYKGLLGMKTLYRK